MCRNVIVETMVDLAESIVKGISQVVWLAAMGAAMLDMMKVGGCLYLCFPREWNVVFSLHGHFKVYGDNEYRSEIHRHSGGYSSHASERCGW